jgi:hypothetical protein
MGGDEALHLMSVVDCCGEVVNKRSGSLSSLLLGLLLVVVDNGGSRLFSFLLTNNRPPIPTARPQPNNPMAATTDTPFELVAIAVRINQINGQLSMKGVTSHEKVRPISATM